MHPRRPPAVPTSGPPPASRDALPHPVVIAVTIALVGALLFVLLAGAMTLGAGLLVVAAVVGRLVGLAIKGTSLDRDRRGVIAAAIAVGSVVLGLIGTWAYGRWEGGVLGPVDYLAETFGVLVPLELAIAGLVAWWSAR